MVKTNSMFLELGTKLPPFEMLDINTNYSEKFNFSKLSNKHLFIMFICAHCPFVKYVEGYLSKLTKDIEENIQTIAISSNNVTTHPDDSPDNLKRQAERNDWAFPYLYDEDQNFAKKLKAACTPDFYLFSNNGYSEFSLFYHGQLDKSRPSNEIPTTGEDIWKAIRALEQGKSYSGIQIPSLGCNIKWTPGNEPEWFN